MNETVMRETAAAEATGTVAGGVKTVLRLEGLTLFVGMVVLYGAWEGSWWVFALLFLGRLISAFWPIWQAPGPVRWSTTQPTAAWR
jgi:hypothetical protein